MPGSIAFCSFQGVRLRLIYTRIAGVANRLFVPRGPRKGRALPTRPVRFAAGTGPRVKIDVQHEAMIVAAGTPASGRRSPTKRPRSQYRSQRHPRHHAPMLMTPSHCGTELRYAAHHLQQAKRTMLTSTTAPPPPSLTNRRHAGGPL